jgi:hypothetical protein
LRVSTRRGSVHFLNTIATTARTPNPDPEPPPLCAPTRIPPPRNLRASVSALVATIEWDAPAGECVIGSYQLRRGLTPGASTTTLFLPASARSFQFPLADGQRVFVRVIADTAAGQKPAVQRSPGRWRPTGGMCRVDELTIDRPATACRFEVNTADAPPGTWFVRVAARVANHGVAMPSNELRFVIPQQRNEARTAAPVCSTRRAVQRATFADRACFAYVGRCPPPVLCRAQSSR